MTTLDAWLMAQVPAHGLYVLALVTFLSCLALPLPASLVMLTGGAFAAAGDLVLWQAAVAALGGAVAGDQAGYWTARAVGPGLIERLSRRPARARALAQVRGLLHRRGNGAVFLTRWLFSPLGPWLNLAAGAAGFDAARFAGFGIAGELVWVGLYMGVGYGFAAHLSAATEALSAGLGFLAGIGAMVALGGWLYGRLRASRGLGHAARQDGG